MSGLVKTIAVGICFLAVGWTLLVVGSANTFGKAVIIAESDALVAFALNVAAVPALIVIIVSMIRAGNRRKQHEAAMAAAQRAMYAQHYYASYPYAHPHAQPPANQPGQQTSPWHHQR